MKIDYDLVEKIGATHVHNNGDLYRVKSSSWQVFNAEESEWRASYIFAANVFDLLAPIPSTPPKPTRTTYEKLSFETIGNAVDYANLNDVYIKKGDRYCKLKLRSGGGDFTRQKHYFGSVVAHVDNLYRKVEKEIDWADVTSEWVQENQSVNIEFLTDAVMYYHGSVSKDKFLEMCRVALCAAGELK